jgi:hypothetical protein
MSFTVPVTRLTRGVACAALILLPSAARAQATPNKANWELAEKFSAANLRSKLFTNAVNPRWLGQSDSLLLQLEGSQRLDLLPRRSDEQDEEAAVRPGEVGGAAVRAEPPRARPAEPSVQQITFSKDRKNFTFNADSSRWEWDIATEMLKRLGPATGAGGGAGRGGRGQGGGGGGQGGEAAAPAADSVSTCGGAGGGRAGGGGGGGGQFGGGRGGDFRNYSPDSSMFAFSREHNLYVVKVSTKDTVQLTRDGVKNYSFGARDTLQERQQQELQQQQQQQDDNQNDDQGGGGGRGGVSRDPRVRANVIWSQDSKAFAVTRMDNRKVGELFLVNNLGNPRPTLMSYTYAMPGETNVGQEELYMFKVGDTKLTPVSIKKWKDQRLFDIHWNERRSTCAWSAATARSGTSS